MPPRPSKRTASSRTAAKKSGAALEAPSASRTPPGDDECPDGTSGGGGPRHASLGETDDEGASGSLGTTSWTRYGAGGAAADAAARPADAVAGGALSAYLFGDAAKAPQTGVSYNDYMATHDVQDRRQRRPPPDVLSDYEENEERFAGEVTLNREGRVEVDDEPDFCTMSCGVGSSSLLS